MLDPRLNSSWWALRLAYGLVPIVAGLDKFTNLLTRWTDYLSPLATRLLPVSPSSLMHLVGVVEICAGVLVLTRFTRQAAWIVAAWLLLIALNLLTTGRYFDVAARDVVLAVGAFALAQLTSVKEDARAPAAADPGPAAVRRPA
ncbi:MAG TPA: DoxX family protein [Myxococcaceae bacterium]|nr:DoxX family protein [Myxococcaceae bacterium]